MNRNMKELRKESQNVEHVEINISNRFIHIKRIELQDIKIKECLDLVLR